MQWCKALSSSSDVPMSVVPTPLCHPLVRPSSHVCSGGKTWVESVEYGRAEDGRSTRGSTSPVAGGSSMALLWAASRTSSPQALPESPWCVGGSDSGPTGGPRSHAVAEEDRDTRGAVR